MVKVYPSAEFEADFPDDADCDEHGDVINPPGRNVASVIAQYFQESGYKCVGPSRRDEHWGYKVHFPVGGARWFGVCTSGDREYHLYVDDISAFDGLFPDIRRKYHAYLRELGRLMQAEPRFQNLRWFSWKDLGHNHPMPAPIEDH